MFYKGVAFTTLLELSYSKKIICMQVEYEDGEERYVEKNELFNKLATGKDVLEARPILPPWYN